MILSIIVPTLKERNFELLIPNDLSFDSEIIFVGKCNVENMRLTENVKIIPQKNKGLYNAINDGIAASKGQFIWVVGDDDVILNLKRVVAVLTENKTQDIISLNVKIKEKIVKTNFNLKSNLLKNNTHHQGIFVNSRVAKDVTYSELYTIAGDFEYIVNLIKSKYRVKDFEIICCDHSNIGLSGRGKLRGYIEEAQIRFSGPGTLFKISSVLVPLRYLLKRLKKC